MGRNSSICSTCVYNCSKTVAQLSWVLCHKLLITHAAWRKHLPSKCDSPVTPFRSQMKAKPGRTKNICPVSRRRNLELEVMDSPWNGEAVVPLVHLIISLSISLSISLAVSLSVSLSSLYLSLCLSVSLSLYLSIFLFFPDLWEDFPLETFTLMFIFVAMLHVPATCSC